MTRIYESNLDTLFIRLLRTDSNFLAAFLNSAVGNFTPPSKPQVIGQARHWGSPGSIDIDLNFGKTLRLLIENKIDAGYSITGSGLGQVERYKKSVELLRANGFNAKSVLLSPRSYRTATKFADQFDICVDYEDLRDALSGDNLELLDSAIIQARTPYEPIQNIATSDFFEKYSSFISEQYPHLKIKPCPNVNGIRPTGSNTVYFEVTKTLTLYNDLPKPRMSLQFLDSNQPTASVKIMIGKWGRFYERLKTNSAFDDIGAYLRPAGQSLGLVIDTQRLNSQSDFNAQLEYIVEGLEAASRLQAWWNANSEKLREWNSIVNK